MTPRTSKQTGPRKSVGPELLEELVRTHAGTLELYASQWTDTPEDCVQEAFVKLVRQRKAPDTPVPWLYRVVRNGAISQARSRQRRRRRESIVARLEVTPTASGSSSLEVAELLDTLALELREVVVARIWGGLSFAEVGEVVGTSTATAYRRYVEALEFLRTQWDEPCPRNTMSRTN